MIKNYQLITDKDGNVSCISVVGTNYSIPLEPGNADYQEYLEWLAEGNTPLPADN